MYKIIINKSVLKLLDKVPAVYLLKIKEAINSMTYNPRPIGSVKLIGSENTWRIRVGVYRIIYTVNDNILTVQVIKIDHRSSVYK